MEEVLLFCLETPKTKAFLWDVLDTPRQEEERRKETKTGRTL